MSLVSRMTQASSLRCMLNSRAPSDDQMVLFPRCDQQGRVAGGLGAVAAWFPIKVCTALPLPCRLLPASAPSRHAAVLVYDVNHFDVRPLTASSRSGYLMWCTSCGVVQAYRPCPAAAKAGVLYTRCSCKAHIIATAILTV